MQYGPFTIRADGLDGRKAFQYEASVLGMLRSLDQWQSGRAIILACRFYRREVLIHPYDHKRGPCNAVVDEHWGMFRTKLTFSPTDFVAGGTCNAPYAPGLTAHEVLYHELVHAVRASAGKRLSFEGRSGEERIAMMVTNVFSSEMNRPLRADYDFNRLTMSPAEFFRSNGDMIRVFYHQHPEFSRWLADCVVPFNPLRIYYQTLTGVPSLRNP